MKLVSIRKPEKAASKVVEANQKAVDALPLASGTWNVQGVPGLYLRCRARAKSFFIQRRVRGRLVKETLGELSMKEAKQKAMKTWSGLKPKPGAHEVVTLEGAIELYLADKKLSPKTIENYTYNTRRYLADWKPRNLYDIGADRAGMRLLQKQITKNYGPSTANQVTRLISSVYRWHRKIDPNLPESPTTAIEAHRIAARDSAYSPAGLQAWWCGVKTLGPIQKAWFQTALFTGARKGSIAALKWDDIDFQKKVIRFRVTKGNRPYSVAMSDILAGLLEQYRDSGDVPPSGWVFPSTWGEGRNLVRVQRKGVLGPHRLRHTFRTTLAELGATSDQARLLMGHSMGGDVSRGYITAPLLIESLRPVTNAVAEHYKKILPL